MLAHHTTPGDARDPDGPSPRASTSGKTTPRTALPPESHPRSIARRSRRLAIRGGRRRHLRLLLVGLRLQVVDHMLLHFVELVGIRLLEFYGLDGAAPAPADRQREAQAERVSQSTH